VTFLNFALPAVSSLLSVLFAGMVFDQWLQKRRSFQLVWSLGLAWYGIGAGTEALGSALGWNEPLYRAWYLFGALFVAAYLGTGTVYLLRRTGFGYFAAFAVFVGGLFAYLSQLRLIHEGRPAPWANVMMVIVASALAALVIAAATTWRRDIAAHVVMALLAVASLLVAVLVFTASVSAPGYALDPVSHVPVGSAMPGYVRILTGPFNIFGALCLVLGAVYSAYIYMPKRRLLGRRRLPPVAAQVYGALAVGVNFVASLPHALSELAGGRLSSRVPATLLIALGGFVPGVTSGLNRFGVTWSFFLGELLGVLLIFTGFLVSEEVFRSLRLPSGVTLFKRTEPS
jgi:hypothetical protein